MLLGAEVDGEVKGNGRYEVDSEDGWFMAGMLIGWVVPLERAKLWLGDRVVDRARWSVDSR